MRPTYIGVRTLACDSADGPPSAVPPEASLAYLGPPETADTSGVPPVLSGMLHGVIRRSSPCILGSAGL